MYYSNRKRAYKVLRKIKRRGSVLLTNEYGARFEVPVAKLEACGYHPVKAKPRFGGAL